MAIGVPKEFARFFEDQARRFAACPGHHLEAVGERFGCEIRVCRECGFSRHRIRAKYLALYERELWPFVVEDLRRMYLQGMI